MILQSNNLNDYLKMTPVIDWDDWRIQEKTAEIVYGSVNRPRFTRHFPVS